MSIDIKDGLKEQLLKVEGSSYEQSDYFQESEFFTLVFSLIHDFVKFIILSIPQFIQYIRNFFSPPPPKCIRGQLALVNKT